jgi:hypothetical protein
MPQPKDHTDTTYFQARNCLQNLRVSQTDFWRADRQSASASLSRVFSTFNQQKFIL